MISRIFYIVLFERLFTTVFLLGSLLIPIPGGADVTADAKRKFEEGVRYFQDENYPMALAAFEASYRLRKSAIVLFNVGMCQKALFRFTESVQSFQTLLTSDDEKVTAAMRQDILVAIESMEEQAGKLALKNLSAKATVSVDGRPVGEGASTDPLLLSPGRHVVTIFSEVLKTKSFPVSVKRGVTVTIDAGLETEETTLRVLCPKGATVYINNVPGGSCPYVAVVEPGLFEVTTKAAGKKPSLDTVKISEGSTATLIVHLENLETTPSTAGMRPAPREDASTPLRTKNNRRSTGLLFSGVAAAALGAAGIAVGVGFTIADIDEYNEVRNIINLTNDAKTDGDVEAYLLYHAEAVRKSEIYEEETHPRYTKGMVVGYAIGGVLAATGVALLIGHAVKHRGEDRVTVRVAPFLFLGTF